MMDLDGQLFDVPQKMRRIVQHVLKEVQLWQFNVQFNVVDGVVSEAQSSHDVLIAIHRETLWRHFI